MLQSSPYQSKQLRKRKQVEVPTENSDFNDLFIKCILLTNCLIARKEIQQLIYLSVILYNFNMVGLFSLIFFHF